MVPLNRSALIEPLRLAFPFSWVGHIPFASWLVLLLKPKLLVELGAHSGNSYCAFCQAIKENDLPTRAYAVDTWKGDEHAGNYDGGVFLELRNYHDSLYADFSELLRMTFDEAVDKFPDAAIDLLHIDGLHTYEAVKHDFETWLPKVSERGVVLFHDTNVRERDFGVFKLWEELSGRYPGFSFEHCHGLGVLLVGDSCPPELYELAKFEHWDFVGKLFEILGTRIEQRCKVEELRLALEGKNEELAKQGQSIQELQLALEGKNQELAKQGENIEELRLALEGKNQELAKQGESISQSLQEMNSKNVYIARLESELGAERQEIMKKTMNTLSYRWLISQIWSLTIAKILPK